MLSLGIKTIDVVAQTDRSILLCDIEASERYRLGKKEDLDDDTVACKIADWYRSLHEKGAGVKELDSLYSEMASFDLVQLDFLKLKVSRKASETIDYIISNFDRIKGILDSFPKTLTYNDFYWTNLVVSYDKSEAFMFDYNMLGSGYRYSDISNVCSSLSEEAKSAFYEAYGGWDINEEIADRCISPIVGLVFAFKKDKFPSWGRELIEMLENGSLFQNTAALLDIC